MKKIIDTTQETLQQSFLLLEKNYRREHRLFYAVVYMVGLLIVLVMALAVYITFQSYIDKLHGQTLRYISDIERNIEIDEIFVRRTGSALKYYWSRDRREPMRLTHGVEELKVSDSMVIELALRKTPIQIIMSPEGKAALKGDWESRAHALQLVSGAAISTLEAIGTRRQGYVIGVEGDFSVFFPAIEDGGLAGLDKASAVDVIREKRKIITNGSRFLDKSHGVTWAGPYMDRRTGIVMMSCFGVLKNDKTGPVIYGADVPVESLLNTLPSDGERLGAIGLFNRNGELIKELGGDGWFLRSAGALMKRGTAAESIWQSGGVFLVEPVHGGFGSVVYGIRYSSLAKAVAAQLLWIGGSGAILLAMLLGFACYWFKHLLQRNYVEERRALEGEMLNLVLVSAAPIGLCIIRKSNFTVMRANTRAISLLDMHDSMILPAEVVKQLGSHCAGESFDVEIEEASRFESGLPDSMNSSARYLNINYAEAESNDGPMLFCAVLDIDKQKSAEMAAKMAKEELERLLQARSYFFSAMSHEIRTPLNTIVGNLELLAEETVSEPIQKRLDAARTASDSLLHVVRGVTDLSKIYVGEMTLEKVDFSPLECLEAIARGYWQIAESKGLDFYLRLTPGVEQLAVGDPQRISQIVANLLSNAFQFTQTGKVVLSACIISDETNPPELEIVVADSGIGMDQDFVSGLFEPLSLGYEKTIGRYGGRGFGLPICMMLCRLMGGRIEAKSIKHVGSVFTVRLPLVPAGKTNNVSNDRKGSVSLMASIPEVAEPWKAWLTEWGWNVIVNDKPKAGMNDVLPYSVDAIVLCDNDSIFAAELAATASAPVFLVRPRGPLWPVHLTNNLVEVSSFHIHALHDALQWLYGGTDLDEISVESIESDVVGNGNQSEEESNKTLTVLIAEDDKFSRKVLADQVASFGFQPAIACDGNEALAILEDRAVDIVLTDLDMPGIGWVDFLNVIKAHWPGLPVVAVSASGQDADIEKGLALGFYDYIAKPVTLDRLSHMFDRFLSENALCSNRGGIVSQDAGAIQKGALWVAFGKQVEDEFGKLETVLAERNSRALGSWMHRMRGALLVLGCKELAAQCLEMERKVESGSAWDETLVVSAECVRSGIRARISERVSPGAMAMGNRPARP